MATLMLTLYSYIFTVLFFKSYDVGKCEISCQLVQVQLSTFQGCRHFWSLCF